jgi:TolB-like protein/DNA-binding winged helix-turn-helix (wHTH) protein/Flp pilus assembly protein TadD
MPTTCSKPRVLRFGQFELYLATGQLRREGKLVHLQEQPFQLLSLLAQRPGELVGRDEIRQELWPDNTFVEFDDSVNHAIKKIREALGDSATNPRFVETVPRQGYRFIAPVRVPETEATSDKPVAAARVQHRGIARRILGIAVAAACLAVFAFHNRTQSPSIRSLAVLPLANLSGDSAQDYFSDGVTESIITDLGQIRGIRVISRTSVMQFKRSNTPLPQIARELGVDALVEGGIVRNRGHVRITAQLVAANPERHLWAASYERDANDIIGLQRDVAQAVAREIRATLGSTPGLSPGKYAANPQAYELYLRGRERLNDFNEPGFAQAVEYLNRAIALDPDYASAHASLGMAYTQMGFLAILHRAEASEKARQAVARALAIDDGLAEAHTVNAYAKFLFDWDWGTPDAEFQRSLELSPNSADAHLLYSLYLTFSGRFEDAIRENQTAIQLDPLNPFVNANLGWTYYMARRSAEGIAFMQTLQQRNPEYPFLHHHLAELYTEGGKCTEALSEAELGQGFDEAFAYARCGKPDRALRLLREAEGEVARGRLDPVYPAWMNAVLGRRDEAFRWLDRAIDEHSVQIVFIKVMPEVDNIRSDPRFAEVLRHAGVN